MPLDVLGRTRATLTEPASFSPWPEGLGNLVKLCRAGDSIAIIALQRGIPSKRESSARVDYVPALCTHRPSLLPIEWLSEVFGLASEGRKRTTVAEKLIKLGHLEEVKVVTRFP